MAEAKIYEELIGSKQQGKKKFSVLIDPDKCSEKHLDKLINEVIAANVDCIFLGGSLMVSAYLDQTLERLKKETNIPTFLFPGSSLQLSYKADALLYLSLISGRNADLLIGKHVETAPFLKISPLEIIPTGYMLVDGGVATSVSYMSNTHPIPASKDSIAMATAMAGEMLGLKLIYMDAGSGAQNPISNSMIEMVSDTVDIPVVVGGGIRTPEVALEKAKSGADIIVVGNAIEKDLSLISEISSAVHSLNSVKAV